MKINISKKLKDKHNLVLQVLCFILIIVTQIANGQLNIINTPYVTFDDGGITTSHNTNWNAAFNDDISTDGVLDYEVHTDNADNKSISFFFTQPYYDLKFEFYNRSSACCDHRIDDTLVFFHGAYEDGNNFSVHRKLLHENEDSGHVIRVSPHTNAGNTDGDPVLDITHKFYRVDVYFSGDVQNFREIKIIGTSVAPVANCWEDNGNSISYPGTATAQEFKTNYLAVGANANIIDNTIAHFDGRVYISEKDDAPNPNNEQGLSDTTSENYQNYLLWVEKGITTNDVAIAEVTDWPDYVFSKDYKLSTLAELKAFIDTNGHLPTMPSVKIVEQNGFSQVDMTKRTIKTIEELTLYTIKQKQKITAIEKEIDAKMEYLQALLEKRKKL